MAFAQDQVKALNGYICAQVNTVRLATLVPVAEDWRYTDDTEVQVSLSAKLRRAPGRLAAGAYILNSGLGKRNADEKTAAMLHGAASTTYPFLGKMAPEDFARLLSTGEIAVGAALLLPVVPAFVAGAALTGFAGALLGLYLRTPGMRQPGSLRPSQQGTAMAKDVWMLGIGLGLMADAVASRDD